MFDYEVSGTFPAPGQKTIYVKVHARVVNPEQGYVGEPVTDDATVNLTVYKVELTEPTVDEEHEEDPGAYIGINDDADSGTDPDYDQAMTDERLAADNEVRQLGVGISPEWPPAGGTLKLYFSDDVFNIYKKKDGNWTKYSTAEHTPITIEEGAEYYYEGKAPSVGYLTLEFFPTGSETSVADDTVKVTVVKVDLGAAGVSDDDEESIGAFVGVNADNDDSDTTIDKDDDTVGPEDDLITLTLSTTPSVLPSEHSVKVT